MTDPSEGFTRRELYAQEDEDRAEIERDLETTNDEIQYVMECLVWWRKRSSEMFLSLSQRHEGACENVRLSYQLMNLTKERMGLERRLRMPSEVTAWEGYSA